MTDRSELLTDLVYLKEGLITPWQERAQLDGNHIKTALDQMTPEESRKARRKFRKLHRKVHKRQHQNTERYRSRKTWEKRGRRPILTRHDRDEYVVDEQAKLTQTYGEKGCRPSIGQARNRRRAVFETLRSDDNFYTIFDRMNTG